MTDSGTAALVRPLRPKRYSRIYPKTLGVRAGYGQRRRDREIARAPLFAALPGWVETADTYERRMAEGNALFVQQQRHRIAEGWRRVRCWLDVAAPADLDEFFRRWAYLPHRSRVRARRHHPDRAVVADDRRRHHHAHPQSCCAWPRTWRHRGRAGRPGCRPHAHNTRQPGA